MVSLRERVLQRLLQPLPLHQAMVPMEIGQLERKTKKKKKTRWININWIKANESKEKSECESEWKITECTHSQGYNNNPFWEWGPGWLGWDVNCILLPTRLTCGSARCVAFACLVRSPLFDLMPGCHLDVDVGNKSDRLFVCWIRHVSKAATVSASFELQKKKKMECIQEVYLGINHTTKGVGD